MKTNKEILKFALPAIIENFLQMLVGVSDTMIVAHLSLSAVAAVSLANNLITVYQAIFIALGTIISSLFAKDLLKKRQKKNQKN
ncbi:MATE family efflux transporter [Lactococcus cremoris]